MKVAFVVQRYGLEVNGGSEFLCRQIAEHMTQHWDLDVLTSCAKEYVTWENTYPPGASQVNGVHVNRFRVDYPRNLSLFNRLSEAVFSEKTTLALQTRWAREQGPYSSEFLRYLKTQGTKYDVFFFFTYLYGFTYFGLPLVADRSILIPTAHDEPPFHLTPFQSLFSKPQAFLFQTLEEQELVLKKFNLKAPHDIVSTGIEDPDLTQALQLLSPLQNRFQKPYILYLGRIDESKGCGELFHYFIQYKALHPGNNLKLVLAGSAVMPIPQHPDIIYLGFIEDNLKYALLANAIVMLMPSLYESLSLATLEAWSTGTPVLVNRKSTVLVGQCLRSGAGASYENYKEFEIELNRFLTQPDFGKQLGKRGQEFVRAHYLWERIEASYLNWGQKIAGSKNL